MSCDHTETQWLEYSVQGGHTALLEQPTVMVEVCTDCEEEL